MRIDLFLLIITAVVAFLSAFAVLLGTNREKRKEVIPYFLSIFFGAVWSLVTFVFLKASPEQSESLERLIPWLFLSPFLMDFFLCFYIFRKRKNMRLFFTVFSVLFFLLTIFIFRANHALFYTNYTISTDGNFIELASSQFYLFYAAFFLITTFIIIAAELRQFIKMKPVGMRGKLFVAGFGVSAARLLMFATGIVLPITNFSLFWLAPVSIALMIAFDYYAILKCRVVDLSSKSLKLLSTVIIVASAATCYVLGVYLVLKFLFKADNLSDDVYVLNYIMAAILFFILPILSDIRDSTKSEIEKDDSHQAEILRKLNKMSPNSDADKLASFLASEYNLSYVGIVIGSKVHGPKSEKFTNLEIVQIMSLGKPEHGIWQKIMPVAKDTLEKHSIKSVAAMFDARGKVFGQILIGSRTGKDELDTSDIENLESIINLISAMIDSRAK